MFFFVLFFFFKFALNVRGSVVASDAEYSHHITVKHIAGPMDVREKEESIFTFDQINSNTAGFSF